ncbi:MAG TPA: CrcB family protein [Pelomicrobium sp.]|nr:CrcB family protein [Pelomicrobium sp.]
MAAFALSLGYVAAGAVVGAILRYLLALFFAGYAISFPWGTLAANAIGCAAIGAITAIAMQMNAISAEARLFLVTGLCGSLTTLSSVVYETGALVKDSEPALASLYLGGTLVVSFAAFYAANFLALSLIRG